MKNNRLKFTWKIGGEAGFGIKSAGLTFAKALARAGFETSDYVEYPSLIRGGHNTYQVTVSDQPVNSVASRIDILVALNQATIDKHLGELAEGAALIYDNEEIKLSPAKFKEKKIKLVAVPLKKLADGKGTNEIMRNTVALGATLALINLPLVILEKIIKELFSRKPEVVEDNLKAIKSGYKYVGDNFRGLDFKIRLETRKNGQRLLLSGNEALSLGALAAGLNFFAAYPMTPSTPILHYLAAKAVETGVIVKHAEDEISVINMALGAAHVGARAMVATSGGGFALMNEGLGLCGISETPLVLVNVQRPGPATGMPTWTEQSDLQFVLHSAQGEFPRILLAPGDREECFYLTALAFNLAEKYQLPVIILSDQFLGEGAGTVPVFATDKITIDRGKLLSENKVPQDYKRYKITPDGISPRVLPGTAGAISFSDSYEHNEYGYSSETAEDRVAQVNKRAQKLVTAGRELGGANLYPHTNFGVGVYGRPAAKLTLVGWGSVKGPILDALALLPEKIRKQINFLHFNVLWPFPVGRTKEVLSSTVGFWDKPRKIVLIENNSTAQLGQLIRQETGVEIKNKILKYDGRPFFPEELAEKLTSLL